MKWGSWNSTATPSSLPKSSSPPIRRRSSPASACRQTVSGPTLLLRRRATLSAGRQSPPDPVKYAEMPLPQLPPRRGHAYRTAIDGATPLPAQFLRPMGRTGRITVNHHYPSKAWPITGTMVEISTTSQAGDLFRLMSAEEQQRLLRKHHPRHGRCPRGDQAPPHRPLHQADPAYGAGVAQALGLDLKRPKSGCPTPTGHS